MPRLTTLPFRAPSPRALTSLLLCALLLLLLAGLRANRASPLFGSTSVATAAAAPPPDPHVARDQLRCTLEPVAGGGGAAFRVVLTNLHPSSTVSLLVPGSVLADGALARGGGGVFDVRESGPLGVRLVGAADASGAVADEILSFGDEDFVDILPFHAMTKEVPLRPAVPGLRAGGNYTVQARGRWRAVWYARLEDYDFAYLKRLGGASGLIDWSYESNALEVAVK
jgi:hypothetical protein